MASNKNYMLNDKFPKHIKNATSTSDGLMSSEDKAKFDGLFEFGLLSLVTQEKDGIMMHQDKKKLDEIEEGANNYVHPSSHNATMIIEDSTHRFVTDDEKVNWNGKASKTVASTTINGLMSKEDKSKLDAIEEGANNYVHPSSHNATMIIEDSTHRFVTDSQITEWNNKASISTVTPTTSGLMSTEDKRKLDAIEEGANNYVHPSSHNATMIIEDSTHRFVTDDEKVNWNGKASATVATQTDNGLMSGTDKKKLDGIATNANNYIHPDTHSATMIIEDSTHRFVTDEQITQWTSGTTIGEATSTTSGLMSTEDKNKLDSIEESANNYVHPTTHPASIIVQDVNNRFVTDIQITEWNSKASTAVATQTDNGLMSKEDKIRLDNLSAGHVSLDASNIIEDINHKFVTEDQITEWNAKASTTVATQTSDGLMSKEDKKILDDLVIQVAEIAEKIKTAIYYA